MTIKQLGGVFGRNPTFNDVTIEGQLTFDGDIDINSDLTIGGNLDVNGTIIADDEITIEKDTPAGVGPELYLHNTANDGNTGHAAEIRFNLREAEATSRNALIGAKALGTYGSDPYIYFSTSLTDSGEPTERVKVLNTGNLELVSGNLVVASGSGIDFSATGTGGAELLDDYEEGEFTVAVTPITSGSTVMNASFDTGTYIKVGHLVTVTGFVVISSVSSPVGLFKINLPITPAASTDRAADAAASIVMNNVASANCADFVGTVNENDAFLYVQLGDASSLQNDSAQELQANTYITFSATYRGA
tara:strand:- start:1028 stop:1939 length:912 start_codon:yes stop_codon:yes gene_type:complete